MPDDIEASEQRILDQVRRESDHVFSQLEALLWLRDLLKPERPFPPTRGWAASPDLLLAVTTWILDTRPDTIVEFGSGTSSVVMAAALRKAGQGHLYSLEHEAEHAGRTRAEVEKHRLSDVATVVDAPLGPVDVNGSEWRWYTVPMDKMPASIDMLFVDGPPGGTWDLARYPAVPLFRDRLTPHAVVYLDDGIRQDERTIAQRWASEDPSFTAHEMPSEKKAWLLSRNG